MIEILIVLAVILAVLIFISLVSFGWGIGMYNTFRVGQQDIQTQWSNIKTEYQRRADMFYNLVQTVKSLKKFEQETLVQVTQARGGFGKIKPEQMKNMKGMDNFFGRLMVVMERYPILQSPKEYASLMKEIRITEDRINIARTDYNEIVGDYNKIILMFPGSLIANLFRFKVEEFFKNEESSNTAPKINLD